MTVLSAQEIIEELDSRNIVTRQSDPYEYWEGWPKRDLEKVIQGASIDLTVGIIEGINGTEGPGVQVPHNSERKLGILERIFPKYRRHRQWERGTQVWDTTALITFSELVTVPDDMAALFVPRSSLMRMGVFCSLGWFDPGYQGHGQCLVHAFGRGGFEIEQNAAIGTLVFFRLGEPSQKPYAGKYQHEGFNRKFTQKEQIEAGMAEVGSIRPDGFGGFEQLQDVGDAPQQDAAVAEAMAQIMSEKVDLVVKPHWVVDVPDVLASIIVDGRADLSKVPTIAFPGQLKRGDAILAVKKISSETWLADEWPVAFLGSSMPDEVREEAL